jgi:hypothetical protein
MWFDSWAHVGPPTTRRLESAPGYAYAAVDLTNAYHVDGYPARSNPAAAHVEREFVFVRDLETLVIFDRLEASAVGSVPAGNIRRAFLAHCEVPWTIEDATHAACANGPSALRATTLLPPAPSRHAYVYEGGQGQYRLEVEDTPGTAQSYLLHVLQARAEPGTNLNPSVVDNGTSYTVVLDPTHSIVFQKGISSSGGSITIAGSTTAFRNSVQTVLIADDGPVWLP